jgi:hypothetical protein
VGVGSKIEPCIKESLGPGIKNVLQQYQMHIRVTAIGYIRVNLLL